MDVLVDGGNERERELRESVMGMGIMHSEEKGEENGMPEARRLDRLNNSLQTEDSGMQNDSRSCGRNGV